MIREVKCPTCGIPIRYEDKDVLYNDTNDFTTTLSKEDGTKVEAHVKYMLCPECGKDVDLGEMNIHFLKNVKQSMEIIYYGEEAMV
jgi:endogenous inhibitor of DNA gyrase (YacG/DUF329 family)